MENSNMVGVVMTMDEIARDDDTRYANQAAVIHQAFADFAAIVNPACDVDSTDVHEGAALHRFTAEVLGAIMMQYFDWGATENWEGNGSKRLSFNFKTFLIELSEALGPDHLENLRKSVAFMIKVDSF